jgi:uncharacterized protein (TIGR02300 family)
MARRAAHWPGLPGCLDSQSTDFDRKACILMTKPEWGTKRTCLKCGTRFYDLTKDEPITCISCGHAWLPEPVLKSKQPLPFEDPAKADQGAPDADLGDELADVDEDGEVSPDDEVDLGGDEDLGVDTGDVKDDQ